MSTDRLQNSPYGEETAIRGMTDTFDKHAKPLFSAGKSRRFKTGFRGSDAELNINNGSLLVTGCVYLSLILKITC